MRSWGIVLLIAAAPAALIAIVGGLWVAVDNCKAKKRRKENEKRVMDDYVRTANAVIEEYDSETTNKKSSPDYAQSEIVDEFKYLENYINLMEPMDVSYYVSRFRDHTPQQVIEEISDRLGLGAHEYELSIMNSPGPSIPAGGHAVAEVMIPNILNYTSKIRVNLYLGYNSNPEVFVMTIVHELCHILLRHNKKKDNDTNREERLTDLATIAVGFPEVHRDSKFSSLGYLSYGEVCDAIGYYNYKINEIRNGKGRLKTRFAEIDKRTTDGYKFCQIMSTIHGIKDSEIEEEDLGLIDSLRYKNRKEIISRVLALHDTIREALGLTSYKKDYVTKLERQINEYDRLMSEIYIPSQKTISKIVKYC